MLFRFWTNFTPKSNNLDNSVRFEPPILVQFEPVRWKKTLDLCNNTYNYFLLTLFSANYLVVRILPAYLKRFDLSHPKFAFV